ncbi:hypothetical protein Tco_0996950 [Tanacetum coccineum]
MVRDQLNERPRKSYCEKIHRATFGRFHRSSRYLKNNDASSPSLATTYYPAAHGHKQVIKPNKFVHFSSNIVYNNEEVDGLKTFNDEKYTSYIVGMKMKMRAPSDVGCGAAVANHDSFGDRISGFINHAKLRLINTSSMTQNANTSDP